MAEARFLQELLKQANAKQFSLVHVKRLQEGLDELSQCKLHNQSYPHDIVLLDLTLPDSQGLFIHKKTVIIQIQDEGIGIPQEDQKQLFQPFHRAENVGRIPGTGLGLAIVKKCVEAHGGDISVNSEVGIGTTFTVTLPLLRA